jgi:uncharacterized membrane protein
MRIPFVTSFVLLLVFLFCSLWLVLVVVSPYLVPSGTLTDLSGSVSVKDNVEQFRNLDPLPKAVYSIGDVECHQIKERSYFLNDNQMPFCARDLGLFMGLAGGFGLVAFYRFRLNPILLMLGLVPMGLDGGIQLVTDYESNNPLRLMTGIIAGVALSLIIAQFVFMMQDDKNKAAQLSPQT